MSVTPCVFCDIVAGKIKSTPVYQDDQVYAFSDIHPKAPVHVLIIPRKHITSVMDVGLEDLPVFQWIHAAAQKIAVEQKLDQNGFRLLVNDGAHGGQAVFHLHYHLMGGRPMAWPPG